MNIKTKNIIILTNFIGNGFFCGYLHGLLRKVKSKNYARGHIVSNLLRSNFFDGEDRECEVWNKGRDSGEKMRNFKNMVLKMMLQEIVDEKEQYRGFNLIAGNLDTDDYFYIGNFYKG